MGKKIQSCCFAICLLASVLVNISFITNKYNGGKLWNRNELSWTRRAAEEAEAVGAIACSGHGRAYVDGVREDGRPLCECIKCFKGPDCSQPVPSCSAYANRGDPLFLDPYWMRNAAGSVIVVSGWHRMTYDSDGRPYMSKELERHIRTLHATVGNVATDSKYIIFGAGSTQLQSAAVFALSSVNSSSPAKVVASSPYPPMYRLQTEYFTTSDFEFGGEASQFKNSTTNGTRFIEFVNSPNDPDGQLKTPVLPSTVSSYISDLSYYWPHYTAIPRQANEDVMLFSLSKLTGHAGSRFGWAIVRDEEVYKGMQTYVELAEKGISVDTQLRAFKLLGQVLKDNGRGLFDFGYRTMADRWQRLSQTISYSKRFKLQELSPQYCTFHNKIRWPSPAYAWLKCLRAEETDCAAVLRKANIIGSEGSEFSADSRYVRLSLMGRQDDFELLLRSFQQLIWNGDEAESM